MIIIHKVDVILKCNGPNTGSGNSNSAKDKRCKMFLCISPAVWSNESQKCLMDCESPNLLVISYNFCYAALTGIFLYRLPLFRKCCFADGKQQFIAYLGEGYPLLTCGCCLVQPHVPGNLVSPGLG